MASKKRKGTQTQVGFIPAKPTRLDLVEAKVEAHGASFNSRITELEVRVARFRIAWAVAITVVVLVAVLR